MSSTKLILWKNQKGSTRYPTIFYKYSTADVLLGIFNFFWTSYFTKQLKTTDCKGFLLAQNVKLLFFRRAVQGQLYQFNKENNVLRAVVKSHKGLKGTKIFGFWVFCKKS